MVGRLRRVMRARGSRQNVMRRHDGMRWRGRTRRGKQANGLQRKGERDQTGDQRPPKIFASP